MLQARNGEASKVILENSLEDEDLTMDELAQVFKEIQSRYEISLAQNKKLKKENDSSKNKFELVLNEKNELSNSFEKIKKDFEKYKTSCKGKSPNTTCNKNEFLEIQKRIKVLDTTLKKCAFNMTKFASMFPKGKSQGKHTHHASNTHKHAYSHKHAFMYGSCLLYTSPSPRDS